MTVHTYTFSPIFTPFYTFSHYVHTFIAVPILQGYGGFDQRPQARRQQVGPRRHGDRHASVRTTTILLQSAVVVF